MYPKIHIFFGIVSFLFLLIFFREVGMTNIFIFSLSSIFIDADHYFYYVVKKKSLNPKEAYNWFIKRTRKIQKMPFEKQKEYKRIFLIFHGIECWLILALLSFYFSIISFVLFGFFFHMLFDWADIWNETYEPDAFFGRVSWVYLLLMNKNKKEFYF